MGSHKESTVFRISSETFTLWVSLCLVPRSVQSLPKDATHTIPVRGCVQRQAMQSVWSLLQLPDIYNPNMSKKASVLGPAWHKLQSTHVCSAVKLLDLLELTPTKAVLFHYRGQELKISKSRHT